MSMINSLEAAGKEASQSERWEGTFREFLQLFESKKYPNIGILSHRRVCNMVLSHGTQKSDFFGQERIRYNFFEDNLYGIEQTVDQIMAYISSAAQRTETARRMLLLWGPPSSGKCLSGDSLVYDSLTGQQIRLDQIVKDGRRACVYAVDDFGKMQLVGIRARQSNGIKQTYTVTTALGHQIEATSNHKFLSFDGWKEVSDLKKGDRIAVARFLPEPMHIHEQSLDAVRFVAYMIAEGNCRTAVRFTNTEECIQGDFANAAIETARNVDDSIPLLVQKDNSLTYRIVKANRKDSRKHHPLITFLKGVGLWGKLAKEKTCGDFVLGLPNDSLSLFLGRLYSCDGSICGQTINYCSASETLVRQLAMLLRRFGIVGKVRYKVARYKSKNGNIKSFDSWQLDITDSSSVRNYKTHIGPHLIGKKKTDFQKFWQEFERIEHTPCGDVFPSSVRQVIKSEMTKMGMSVNAKHYREKGSHFLRTDRTNRSVSRVKLQRIATALQSEKLQQIVNSDVYYDKIVKIELGRMTEVFDIEVPVHHNFVVNGIVAHNSDLVTLLKRGLETYSRTDDGALFAIKGSKTHENPFLLVPHHQRKDFEKTYGVPIEGSLNPHTALILEQQYKGNFMEMPIERIFISEASRVGIGTWLPSDSKTQDISDLIGGIDYAKIQQYGNEADPRAYNFDGELFAANRGIMEFIEGLKADEKFLRVNLTATQEKMVKAPRFGLIYVDCFIILHTNQEEFTSFMMEKKYEAYHDRMVIVRMPYNLSVSNEVKIYEKLLQGTDARKEMHISPRTLEVAAMFAVLSRLHPSAKSEMTVMKKLKLYDGQHVKGFKREQVPDIKKESKMEGMSGISPRFVIDQISAAISQAKSDGRDFITPLDVLRQLQRGIHNRDKFTEEEKTRFEQFIDSARAEWNDQLRNDIQKAFFLSYEDESRNLCENYLDHIEAACAGTLPRDPVTNEEVPIDEKLMDSVEDQIDITSSGKDDFRNEILRAVGVAARKNLKFDYTEHSQLREGIQKAMFEERKGVIRMTVSSRNPDPEAIQRLNEVIARMCNQQSYSAAAANELLKYASAHLFDK